MLLGYKPRTIFAPSVLWVEFGHGLLSSGNEAVVEGGVMRVVFGMRQEGVALVELAILFPLIILILSGVVNYGYALKEHAAMVESARAGARVAAQAQGLVTGDELRDMALSAAAKFIDNSGYSRADYTLNIRAKDLATNARKGIQVTVSRDAGQRFWAIRWAGFDSCASSYFTLLSNVAPTEVITDPTCLG